MKELRKEFLRRYSKRDRNCNYRYENVSSYMRNDNRAIQILSNIYKEYKSGLNMHFDKFVYKIFHIPSYRFGYCRYKTDRSKFQQKGFEKKTLSEDEKRQKEWRKKFAKDKANRKSWKRGYKKFAIKRGHRKMRNWSRGIVNKDCYSLEREWRKSFINPWDWD